jgi:hypothetical protein
MTDTLIICLTVLIIVFALIGTWLYHQAQRQKATAKHVDMAGRLSSALIIFGEKNDRLHDMFENIPKSVSALSERQVVLEGAIKAALAELVRVTGYSEAKYQQLMAKTVTAPRKPQQ